MKFLIIFFFINLRVQAFLEYPNIWDRDSLKKNPPPPRIYNYGLKPKNRPGPIRVIANSTDKTYIGIISHDGTTGNAAAGDFSLCPQGGGARRASVSR